MPIYNPEDYWSNLSNPDLMNEVFPETKFRKITRVLFDKIKMLCYTIRRKYDNRPS